MWCEGFRCRCSEVTEGRGDPGGRAARAVPGFEYEGTLVFCGSNPPNKGTFQEVCQVVKFPGLFQAELRKLDASLEERRSIQKVLQIAQKAQNHHGFYDVLCGTTMLNNEILCVMPRR